MAALPGRGLNVWLRLSVLGKLGFVAQMAICKDSLCESSAITDCHEQLDTDDVQDPEPGGVQSILEATRISFDLVLS